MKLLEIKRRPLRIGDGFIAHPWEKTYDVSGFLVTERCRTIRRHIEDTPEGKVQLPNPPRLVEIDERLKGKVEFWDGAIVNFQFPSNG